MRFNPHLSAVVLAGMTACLPLSAQDEVAMKIDVVAWGDDVSGLSFKAPKKADTFTARAFKYSEPIGYRGPRILAIHQSEEGATPAPHRDNLSHWRAP